MLVFKRIKLVPSSFFGAKCFKLSFQKLKSEADTWLRSNALWTKNKLRINKNKG